MEEYQHEPQEEAKRPLFLSVLCILTFISCGLSVLGSLSITPMADVMIKVVKETEGYDPAVYADQFLVWKAGWGFYMLVLFFTLCSLTGAILMWNLKKMGFHFYAISNIILFYLPILWVGIPFNFGGLFFLLGFIGMYALHLKYMK
jgi:hypothetical protein